MMNCLFFENHDNFIITSSFDANTAWVVYIIPVKTILTLSISPAHILYSLLQLDCPAALERIRENKPNLIKDDKGNTNKHIAEIVSVSLFVISNKEWVLKLY